MKMATMLLAALLVAHLAFSFAFLSPGYLSVDEGTYHVMVNSLARHGSLAFSNGYEEFPSLELMTGSVRLHEGRLVPITPILFAIVSLPFYRAAGYAGLFVVNNLAFLGILALTAALAHRLFRDRPLAMLSIAIRSAPLTGSRRERSSAAQRTTRRRIEAVAQA